MIIISSFSSLYANDEQQPQQQPIPTIKMIFELWCVILVKYIMVFGMSISDYEIAVSIILCIEEKVNRIKQKHFGIGFVHRKTTVRNQKSNKHHIKISVSNSHAHNTIYQKTITISSFGFDLFHY